MPRVGDRGEAKRRDTQVVGIAGALQTPSRVANPRPARLGEQLERTEAQRLADAGWIEWGGELIWVAGFTSGGAPYGLWVCDFDRADLEAMGLDVAALDDAGLLEATDKSNDCVPDDDVPF